MDRPKLSKYVLVFKKINSRYEYNYSQRQLSELSGIDRGVISRFLNGHNDMASARFFNLIESMPKDFQKEYWTKVGIASSLWEDEEINWEAAIDKIDKSDKKTIGRILSALGNRYLAN